jgi:hypothetical protein
MITTIPFIRNLKCLECSLLKDVLSGKEIPGFESSVDHVGNGWIFEEGLKFDPCQYCPAEEEVK